MRRPLLLTVALTGAAGSLWLMLRVGQHTPPPLLVIFTLWVLAPFASLVLLHFRSPRWSSPTRNALSTLTLILTSGTLAVYAKAAFGPPMQKPAAIFLMVPLVSYLLLAIVLTIAAKRSAT